MGYHRNVDMLIDGARMNDDCAAAIVESVFNLGDGKGLILVKGLPWKP